MAEAAFHLIQHAFTQRTVGETQLLNGKRIKHAAEDSQTRYEYRLTLVRKTRQAKSVKTFMLQHFFGQQGQAFRRDKPVFSPIASRTSCAALMVPDAPSATFQP